MTHPMTAEPLRVRVAWAMGSLAVAALVVLLHMHAFTMLSFIDEYQHVDYLDKTMKLEHVRGGERVGQAAMREQACRGIDYTSVLPACDSKRLRPDQFPGRGFNHTYADPPTYYLVTGAGTAVVRAVPGVESIVTAGRSIGILWLAGGLWVTVLLARRLGANRPAAAGAALLLAATPSVALSSATITTDAPMLLVGGVLCLVALDVVGGRRSHWWLLPAAAVCMGVKFTTLPVIGVVVVFLLLQRAAPHEEPRLPTLRAAGVTLLGATVPAVAWSWFNSRTELPSVADIPMGQYFRVDAITLEHLTNSLRTTFSPVVHPASPPFLDNAVMNGTVQVLNLLLILGVAGLAWFWPWAGVAGRMGVATLVGMLASGPGFVVLLFVSMGVTYTIPGRYGLAVLPIAVSCLALVASRRPAGGRALVVLGLMELGLFVASAL